MSALPLVPSHNGVDMVPHDRLKGLVVPVSVRNPAGQLAVPNQSVAAEFEASRSGSIGVLVSRAPVELTAVGLDGLPLHGVLRGDGSKLILVVENVGFLIVIANGKSSAKVLLTSSLHGGLKPGSLSCFDITTTG
ncbi:hypothetical protein HG530_010943 [Fusarium avenaceum]|nr:hypothetical protein HG530_010943 [Fusarium avenaceum]